MFSEFKNNGFWVPVALLVSFGLTIGLAVLVSLLLGDKFVEFSATFSIAVVLTGCGYYFKYLDDDHIIDDKGIKHYMEFDNQFLYISMKAWIYICWIIAGFAAFGAVVNFIQAVMK